MFSLFTKKLQAKKLQPLSSMRSAILMEVIVAFVILAITGLTAAIMITNANDTGTIAKQEFIATNLAREGLEGVRNIIETNWIRFSFDRDSCWLMKPEMTTCDSANKFFTGTQSFYSIKTDPAAAYNWLLAIKAGNSANDFTDPLKKLNVYLSEYNTAYGLRYNEGTFIYDSLGAKGTTFYRQIIIKYGKKADGITDDTSDLIVTCNVSWLNKTRQFDVVLSTHLTNYLK